MNNKQIITIAIIAVIVIGAGAFYGGTVYEKNILNKQGLLRSATRGQFSQGQGQGQFRQGGSNGSGFGHDGNGGFIGGEIVSKDDPVKPDGNGASQSITIKMSDGSTKIVFFSDSTNIGKAEKGSSSDLAAGQQVMVNGTANQDGTVTAQNIQIRPEQ
jgi:hypothetical protein